VFGVLERRDSEKRGRKSWTFCEIAARNVEHHMVRCYNCYEIGSALHKQWQR